jgi:ATP synthase I chain
MTPTEMAVPSRDVESAAAIRLGWLTLAVGLAAAVVVALSGRVPMGAGLAIGTLLAWLNYRWLKVGVDALVAAATEADGASNTRVPAGTYVKFAGRYLLIGLAVYASVSLLKIPVLGLIYGLLALGAAALIEGIYEVISGWNSVPK